jgi:hypothetical protein
MAEATSPAIDPNKKILIPYPLSLILSLQKDASFKVYAILPKKQMIRLSPGPTLPKRGKRMTYMAMAQATAWPRVKYNISLLLVLPMVCTIPESLIFKGLSPRVTVFEGSARLMAYQNFLTRKYH